MDDFSADLETGNVRERARAVSAALRDFVVDGVESGKLSVGDRIPTERELMQTFGGGRNIVRKTLISLEEEGLLERRVGSGTFVADPKSVGFKEGFDPALLSEIASQAGPVEVMELRHIFEPEAAALAAMRASVAEMREIRSKFEWSIKARSLEDFEQADDEFHAAIAHASRNVLVSRVYEIVSAVRNQTEWGMMKKKTLLPEHRITHSNEHEAILKSIEARDGSGARDAMRDHLRNVDIGLFGKDR